MGRMSLEEKQRYIDYGKIGILEDGRMILQEGTEIECLDCGHKEKLDKFFIAKYRQCENCGKGKELTYDGEEKESLPLVDLEELPEPKEEKEKKQKDSRASKIFKFKSSLFSDSETLPVDKEKVKESAGKDLKTWLRNISEKDLLDAYVERQAYPEQEDEIYEALNKRHLMKKAKMYERGLKEILEEKEEEEPEEEIEEEEEEKPKKKKKKLWRKKPGEEEEEELEELEEKMREMEKKEKIIKGKVKRVIEEKPKLKRLTEYFSVEGIAKAITNIDVEFLNVWFSEDDYIEDDEKESLQYIWELAVDYYAEDIEKLMSWMSIVLLVMMHGAILGKRIKKWWTKRQQKGEPLPEKIQKKMKELYREEGITS